jgi:PKHD-type hydroxylase
VIRLARKVLGPDELREVHARLAGAPFTAGAGTAHGSAAQAKHNLQLGAATPAGQAAGQVIAQALMRHEEVMGFAMPKTMTSPMFARYGPGMAYGDHLDLPMMGSSPRVRTDLSITVFLSGPADYDGGELTIALAGDGGQPQRIKGEAGDAVIYPSGTTHQVAPVTRGERVVAVNWVQSLIRDAAQRQIVIDLALAATTLARRPGNEAEVMQIRRSQYALMRLWLDP